MIHNNIYNESVIALIQVNSQWEVIEIDGRDRFCYRVENRP